MSVVNFWDNKPTVNYTFSVPHHPKDGVTVFVHDVSDSPKSRDAALWALAEAAKHKMTAEQIHAALLSRIDALMGTAEPAEIAELSALAGACQAYEEAIYP